MEIWERVSQQRVKHIVSSYQLAGDTAAEFDAHLEDLLHIYPSSLIELALVETLADSWLMVPLPRGMDFLAIARDKLIAWSDNVNTPKITPEQFRQITGLDPGPVFGPQGLPPTRPTGIPDARQ